MQNYILLYVTQFEFTISHFVQCNTITFTVILYVCVSSSTAHRFITNLTVTSAVVLNGPVLCSWMLLAAVMWPSIVLLKTVKIRVALCLTLNNHRLTKCH